jgi:predicted HD superfamily hydrolase involved in NAD metabolism
LTDRELTRAVRAHIGQKHRYAHTLRVARVAQSLARAHGESPPRARLAAMLHDVARLYSSEDLLRACTARGMVIDEFERQNPIVLHARVGAELARERFGVTDEGVLSAIRLHTLGAPRMSPLDAIVFLADGLEPGRDFPERASYLRTAYRDLDRAVAAVLRSSVRYLRQKGLGVAPQTEAALGWYERPRGEATGIREHTHVKETLCRT